MARRRKKTRLEKFLQQRASTFRKHPTKAEHILWQRLRRKHTGGFRFRRQHPIGGYIVDFYCAQAKLVIEVDGPIHQYTQKRDLQRTQKLESLGLQVIRFSNYQIVHHLDIVLQELTSACLQRCQNKPSFDTNER